MSPEKKQFVLSASDLKNPAILGERYAAFSANAAPEVPFAVLLCRLDL